MKRLLLLLPVFVLALVAGCSNDGENSYEFIDNYRKDLCLFTWHGAGTYPTFRTDDGNTWTALNQSSFPTLKVDSAYRMMIVYTPNLGGTTATIADMFQIPMLADSTRHKGPSERMTSVDAVWMGGGFFNFLFRFKHDGSKTARAVFAYRVDTIAVRSALRDRAHVDLSLYYRRDDTQAANYDETMTFSLDPKPFALEAGDTVTIHTRTAAKEGVDYQFVW